MDAPAPDSETKSEPASAATPESPPPPALAKGRRSRGFWLKLALGIFVGAPLLVAIFAWCYINFGFLGSSLSRKLARLFDAPVTVEATRSPVFQNLTIEKIVVEPKTGESPLSIGSIKAEWDLGPLLWDDRIRAVSIDRPKIDLRRDAAGEWNLSLKPQPKSEGGYAIQRIKIANGDVGFEWAPGRRVHIQNLILNLDNHADAADPISASASWDSHERIAVTGLLGPGDNVALDLRGGAVIEKDLSGVFGNSKIEGRLDCDLSGQYASGYTGIDGRLTAERFKWMSSGGTWGLKTPSLSLNLSLRDDPVAPIFELNAGTLGNVRGMGRLSWSPAVLAISEAEGQLDLEATRDLFVHAGIQDLTVRGRIDFSNWAMTIPLSSSAPDFAWTSAARIQHGEVAWRGVGGFPPLSATFNVVWPALKEANLSLGPVGSIAFEFPNIGAFEMPPSEKTLRVNNVHIDLGHLLETEFMRRKLLGAPEGQPLPVAAALPYRVSGAIRSKGLTFMPAKTEGFFIQGLKLENAAILEWPFDFPVPPIALSGEITPTFLFKNGAMTTVEVQSLLSGPKSPAGATTSALYASMSRSESGAWVLNQVGTFNTTIPLAEIAGMFGVTQRTGLVLGGRLVLGGGISGGETLPSGRVTLDDASLEMPVPSEAQAMAASICRMAGQSAAALALETMTIKSLSIKGVNGEWSVRPENGELWIIGGTKKIAVKMKASLGFDIEYEIATLPEINLTGRFPLAAGMPSGAGTIDIDIGKLARLAIELKPGAKGATVITGTLKGPSLAGASVAFETGLNLGLKTVGPVRVTMSDLNVAKLGRSISDPADPFANAWAGTVRRVQLDCGAFNWQTVSTDTIPAAAFATEFEDVSIPTPGREVAGATGSFRIGGRSGNNGFSFNSLLKLTAGEALVNGIYVAPIQSGPAHHLQIVGNVLRGADGLAAIRLDKFEADAGGLLRFGASGVAQFTPTGVLTHAELPKVALLIPDAGAFWNAYVLPQGYFGIEGLNSLALKGPVAFTGRASGSGMGSLALQGLLEFQKNSAEGAGLRIEGLSGTLPVVLRRGPWPDWPEELKGSLKWISFEVAGIKTLSYELPLLGTHNRLTALAPLALEADGQRFSIEDLSLRDPAAPEFRFAVPSDAPLEGTFKRVGISTDAAPTLVSRPAIWRIRRSDGPDGPWILVGENDARPLPLTVRGLFGVAPTAAKVSAQSSASTSAETRRAARAAAIAASKSRGEIGEAWNGRLALTPVAGVALAKKRETLRLIGAENVDREVLFRESGDVNAAAEFARKQLGTAAPGEWIQKAEGEDWRRVPKK